MEAKKEKLTIAELSQMRANGNASIDSSEVIAQKRAERARKKEEKAKKEAKERAEPAEVPEQSPEEKRWLAEMQELLAYDGKGGAMSGDKENS